MSHWITVVNRATPFPWRVADAGAGRYTHHILDANGRPVAIGLFNVTVAGFIVQVCNETWESEKELPT